MNTADTIALISLAFAVLAGGLGQFFWIVRELDKIKSQHQRELGAMNVKLDTLWEFQMRRGGVEAVVKGIATMNSPLTFKDGALEKLAPMKLKLQNLASDHPDYNNSELSMMIERKFGDELLATVCIPCGMYHGACLVMALAVARGVMKLEI